MSDEQRRSVLDPSQLTDAKRALLARRLRERRGSVETIPSRGDAGPAPLSFAQQRLWLLEQLEGGLAAYNVPRLVRVGTSLDVEVLQRALDAIVERHEVLRAVVRADAEPHQVVLPPRTVELGFVDVRELPAGEREREIDRLVLDAAGRPFDLERDQLLRSLLIRAADGDDRLLLVQHHLASDRDSRAVLFGELSALYAAFAAGRPSPLPRPPLQYSDFAVWQRERLSGDNLERLLGYWRAQLAGAPAVVQLPTDRRRPAVQTYRGERLSVSFPAELLAQAKDVSRKAHATLFMTLAAAFAALLGRMSGEEDIVVGTTISGRPRPEVEGLIGLFANTLALRVDLSGDPTFAEFVGRVRDVSAAAYAHQELPFEKLVEEINPERSLAHAPIVQAVFEFDSEPGSPPELAGAPVEPRPLDLGWAKNDLTLSLTERPDGIAGLVEYSVDLFDRAAIEELVSRFEILLAAGLEAPETPVSALPLLRPGERELLTRAPGPRDYPHARPLHELFSDQAARSPEAVAVVAGIDELTYRELEARANQVAHRLRALGVVDEALVGLCVERSADMLVGLLGILKAGAAYVPLDPAFPAERLAFMESDSGMVALVAQEPTLGWRPASDLPVLLLDRDRAAIDREPEHATSVAVDSSRLAYVIYTSGSTGVPKGVEIPHGALVNLLWSVAREPGLTAADVLVAVTTLSFDIAALELYLPLLVGGRVVVASRDEASDPLQLGALLERSGATAMQATPTTWRMLVESGWQGRQAFKALCGGEALPQSLADELSRRASLWNMYGPTETTIWSTAARIEPGDRVTIGAPLGNTDALVLDGGLEPVPPGVVGELYLGGDGLARGYHARPELTAERFVAHPFRPGERLYRTGDLARVTRDGRLDCLGRIDHQVKVRGFRIELGEVEAALERAPSVASAVAVVREDVPGVASLVAYVTGPASGSHPQELRARLERELPAYMVPSAIVVLEAIPLTPNGKVDRASLPEPARVAAGVERVAPRTPTEEVLAAIWAEALAAESLGVHEDFFALGGHSLAAARVMARVRTTFGIELGLRSLFEAPSIARLATVVDETTRGEKTTASGIEPLASRAGLLAVSSTQERMWFLDRLDPGTALYNVPFVLRVRGALDPGLLGRAFDLVVARHETLRTALVEVDGRPFARIEPTLRVPLPVVDLTHDADPSAAALAVADAVAREPFDLARAPLVRATLVRVAEDEHVLALALHHAVSDGWSLGVLRRELATLYDDLAAGGNPDGAAPAIQFADYAAWQRARLESGSFDDDLAYWRDRLAGAPELLELPTDRPRPAVQSHRGSRFAVVWPRHLLDELRNVAAAEGATLYMLLLASFGVLMQRYSGRNDIVVGTPIANRGHEELERLIGYFANTLALRLEVDPTEPFSALLARTRGAAVGAYAHAELPFERLVEELQPERSLSHSPLFQVLFVMQNREPAAVESGLSFEPDPSDPGTARFDLTLSLSEREDGLRASFEYAEDLFEQATVERMATHLEALLRGVAAGPAVAVGDLPMLSDAELQQFVTEAESVGEDGRSACVHELFEAQAVARPDAVAIRFGADELTYGQLEERSARVAQHLHSLGVGPGSLVGVWVERHLDLMTAILGVLRSGAAYVPLEPTYPADRLMFTIEDAAVDILLTPTSAELLAGLPVRRERVVSLVDDALAIAACPATDVPRRSTPPDLAYVIYTSGSTGLPKGVQIEHRSVVNLMRAMSLTPGMTAGDVLAAITTPAFDLSVPDLFLPLTTGGCMLIVPRETAADGARLAALLERERVSVMQATATTWRLLVAAGWSGSQDFRLVCGGEAFPHELVDELLDRAGQVWHAYGPTEATVWASLQKVERGHPLRLSPPIANYAVYVRDARLRPVPVGVTGEICIAGVGLARGYLGRDELTADRFVADPLGAAPGGRLYRTGDLGRWRGDGTIEFLGRGDDQVKLRGYRIELGEIEESLRAHEQVRAAVVALRDDALVGYVVPEDGCEPDATALRRHLGESLPDYMIPGVFVMLDAFPLTTNRKVDRRALPAPESLGLASRRAFVAPRSPVEEELAEMVAGVLQTGPVGIDDNFFDLGGHSLKATQLVSRLRDRYELELPLRTLYERPTVAALAEVVSAQLVLGHDEAALDSLLAELDELEHETEVHP
jgi:amino acid adenylation domain-containing protein